MTMEEIKTTEQTSSLWERLKICWHVLTKKNYIYFGIGKNAVEWEKNGKFLGVKNGKLRCYTYVKNEPELMTVDGPSNFHNVVWATVEKFSQLAQKGEA